ncbi:hypothetical protein EYF80_038743 [Liparis tanakae]|uniref:Uncharacterized protein n=1 Tax=Liparis tanakae TaxID=230148 RepID=A0A4Z2GEF8_9TELE|nr:hypothetical protein EYF80_038743 [Liparis tanakae]
MSGHRSSASEASDGHRASLPPLKKRTRHWCSHGLEGSMVTARLIDWSINSSFSFSAFFLSSSSWAFFWARRCLLRNFFSSLSRFVVQGQVDLDGGASGFVVEGVLPQHVLQLQQVHHVLGTLGVDEAVGRVQGLGFVHPPSRFLYVARVLRGNDAGERILALMRKSSMSVGVLSMAVLMYSRARPVWSMKSKCCARKYWTHNRVRGLRVVKTGGQPLLKFIRR